MNNMNYAYATAQEAADVVGITPGDIGVPPTHYVRKKDLIATGKFDESSLTEYDDIDYVLLRSIAKGSFQISLAVNSDVTSRGTVQINSGVAGSTATAEVNVGNEVIAKCNLLKEGDVFNGWYNGSSKVSENATYSFTVTASVSLTAKINFIDVDPDALSFGSEEETKTFGITSNVEWSLS